MNEIQTILLVLLISQTLGRVLIRMWGMNR